MGPSLTSIINIIQYRVHIVDVLLCGLWKQQCQLQAGGGGARVRGRRVGLSHSDDDEEEDDDVVPVPYESDKDELEEPGLGVRSGLQLVGGSGGPGPSLRPIARAKLIKGKKKAAKAANSKAQ